MRVGAPELGRTEPEVEAVRQLVEEIKARRRVLDFDRIEIKLRRKPASTRPASSGAAARAARRAGAAAAGLAADTLGDARSALGRLHY